MKIQCNSAELAKVCSNIQRTVSNKSTIPALEGILIDAANGIVSLTGYDLEVGSTAKVEADITSEGKIVLNAKNLCDILRMLPDDMVTIDCDERNISKIKSGETEYSLIGTPADDYPELPSVNKYTSITLPFGTPPRPSAMSRLNEPVGTVSTETFAPASPSFITVPLPKSFSNFEIAASRALFLSSFAILICLLLDSELMFAS